MLSSSKLFLRSLENKMGNENKEPLIDKVYEIIDESIIILKELSQNLSPHILTNHGLDFALNFFLRKIEREDINVIYESDLTDRLSNSMEIGLYRVITEMVNNSLKYSEAKQIRIRVSRTGNRLILNYSDDGCGFDVDSMLKTNKGNGLFNIINRMKAMEAKFRFISSPGNGFSFDASIKT